MSERRIFILFHGIVFLAIRSLITNLAGLCINAKFGHFYFRQFCDRVFAQKRKSKLQKKERWKKWIK